MKSTIVIYNNHVCFIYQSINKTDMICITTKNFMQCFSANEIFLYCLDSLLFVKRKMQTIV